MTVVDTPAEAEGEATVAVVEAADMMTVVSCLDQI